MKVPITLTIDIEYQLTDDFPKENIIDYLENRHCIENIINFLRDNQVEGICTACFKGKVKVKENTEC